MKAKHSLLLFAIGYCLDFLGAYLKITHKSGADLIFLLAAVFKTTGAVLLVYKIITYPPLRKFLNH